MRRLLTVILFAGLFVIPAQPKHSGATHSASKTEHVREYTRKDGTVVHAHDRAAAGTARVKSPESRSSASSSHPPSPPRDEHGGIKRSESAKHDFERANPCPSTGKTNGGCSGYVVDHVRPLACGGADAPSNMQWQTVAQAKAKDGWERNNCN